LLAIIEDIEGRLLTIVMTNGTVREKGWIVERGTQGVLLSSRITTALVCMAKTVQG
jgi:hypothetical protein